MNASLQGEKPFYKGQSMVCSKIQSALSFHSNSSVCAGSKAFRFLESLPGFHVAVAFWRRRGRKLVFVYFVNHMEYSL